MERATISKFLAAEVGRDGEQPWLLKKCMSPVAGMEVGAFPQDQGWETFLSNGPFLLFG